LARPIHVAIFRTEADQGPRRRKEGQIEKDLFSLVAGPPAFFASNLPDRGDEAIASSGPRD
jgi:hypothetical protein